MIENTLEIPVEKHYDIDIRVTHPNPSLFREGLIDRINFLLITLTRFQMLKSYMTISLSLVSLPVGRQERD